MENLKDTEPLEKFDFETSTIPARSHLYSLEPIGIGTSECESIISYVSRVAEAHAVKTGILVSAKVGPLMNEAYVFEGRDGGLDKIFANCTKALNGSGNWAHAFTKALEQLTLRKDLSYLTFIPWQGVLPSRNLLKLSRAWCPTCFHEWAEADGPIYEPLIWSCQPVEVCPKHHQPLRNTCLYCGENNRSLAWKSRNGYCSKCNNWLGDISGQLESSLEEIDWQKQSFVHTQLEEMIALSSSLDCKPNRDHISNYLTYYCQKNFSGNHAAFGRYLDLNPAQMHRWVTGKCYPSLLIMLKICSRLNISLAQLLLGTFEQASEELNKAEEAVKEEPVKEAKLTVQFSPFRKRNRQVLAMEAALHEEPPPTLLEVAQKLGLKRTTALYYHDADLCNQISQRHDLWKEKKLKIDLEIAVEIFLDQTTYPPPSLAQVCREIGVTFETLKKKCPDLCEAVSKQYSDFRKEEKKRRYEKLLDEIRIVAISLSEQSIEPTASRISPLLSKPGSILQREAKLAVLQVRKELGWEKDCDKL